jgi:hypothetical protein
MECCLQQADNQRNETKSNETGKINIKGMIPYINLMQKSIELKTKKRRNIS